MLTLTIDGKEITVPEGTTVLQACEKAGCPIPFYCYHPGLSIAGNCRICLVEIDKIPKLQIGCNTRAAEGMIVHTASDKVLKARQDVLEFLLINHPLDCPVCDQAGECWLQDYYMRHGLYDPKFDEMKQKKRKAFPIGPTVMLDTERCILCSRCVRFTDELTRTGEFGIFNRGDRSEIGIHPGRRLENKYSGNVVDICPVGALTDRDFRFKCRVWYLGSAKSICPGCSRGCNIELHYNREREWSKHIAEGARLMRLKPRYNPDVNKWWMCDEGRYGYKFVDQNRLSRVLIKDAGTQREDAWEKALDLLAGALDRLRGTGELDQVGIILSSRLTNEELFIAKRLFSELGVAHLTFQRPRQGESDTFLIQSDKSPNSQGARALDLREEADSLLDLAAQGGLQVLYVLGEDLTEVFDPHRIEQVAGSLEMLIFQGTNINATSKLAHLVLPGAVYAEKEGTFTNFEGRIQRIYSGLTPIGESKVDWVILAELARRLGIDMPYADVPEIFQEMAKGEHSFKRLTWESIGAHGVLLSEGVR